MNGHEAIVAAARIAKQLLELPEEQVALWGVAHRSGMSYNGISRALTVEMLRMEMTPAQIEATGTGPDNIRKQLTRRL